MTQIQAFRTEQDTNCQIGANSARRLLYTHAHLQLLAFCCCCCSLRPPPLWPPLHFPSFSRVEWVKVKVRRLLLPVEMGSWTSVRWWFYQWLYCVRIWPQISSL